MKTIENKVQRKYMSQLLFNNIKNFLKNRHDISRKELCTTFNIFKYNTLKNEDSRGIGIGVSAKYGRSAIYTPQRIINYIEQKFKIVTEEDIDFCNL